MIELQIISRTIQIILIIPMQHVCSPSYWAMSACILSITLCSVGYVYRYKFLIQPCNTNRRNALLHTGGTLCATPCAERKKVIFWGIIQLNHMFHCLSQDSPTPFLFFVAKILRRRNVYHKVVLPK